MTADDPDDCAHDPLSSYQPHQAVTREGKSTNLLLGRDKFVRREEKRQV